MLGFMESTKFWRILKNIAIVMFDPATPKFVSFGEKINSYFYFIKKKFISLSWGLNYPKIIKTFN